VRKVALSIAAAALVASASLAGSAGAQDHRDWTDRVAMTADQIAAEDGVHMARFKADLRLTADQQKNWLEFENALYEIRKAQPERQGAQRAERGQRNDVIGYLTNRATFLADRSAEIRKLMEASQPLYVSLDEQQKRLFADELTRLNLW